MREANPLSWGGAMCCRWHNAWRPKRFPSNVGIEMVFRTETRDNLEIFLDKDVQVQTVFLRLVDI
jgi:hypothetical protein